MKRLQKAKKPRFFIGDKVFIEGLWKECFLFVEEDTGHMLYGSIWSAKLGRIVDSHVMLSRDQNWKQWKGNLNLLSNTGGTTRRDQQR